jgi:hypothetical protein
MKNLTIKIYKAESEDGFFYDIFNIADIDDDSDPIGGGLCTGTINDALEMAFIEAKTYLK